jgi:hypothetical protein
MGPTIGSGSKTNVVEENTCLIHNIQEQDILTTIPVTNLLHRGQEQQEKQEQQQEQKKEQNSNRNRNRRENRNKNKNGNKTFT